eukprot:6173636-Pleurochrysis_carterae.AAC.5
MRREAEGVGGSVRAHGTLSAPVAWRGIAPSAVASTLSMRRAVRAPARRERGEGCCCYLIAISPGISDSYSKRILSVAELLIGSHTRFLVISYAQCCFHT